MTRNIYQNYTLIQSRSLVETNASVVIPFLTSCLKVLAAGPRDDATYGVMARLISYVTGPAQEDGFGGLAGGYGDRQNMLTFDADSPDPTFRFRRTGH